MDPKLVFAVSGNASIDEYYLVDSIPRADEAQEAKDYFQRVGGAASNVAVAMAKLGVKVFFIGAVGGDKQGDFILDNFSREGVDTKWIVRSSKPTGRVIILLDSNGDRAMVALRGANTDLTPGFLNLEEALRGVEHVHLSSTKPEYTSWVFEIAKSKGVTTSYDPGMTIASKGFSYVRETLRKVDILFVNKREYETLGPEYLDSQFNGLLVLKEGSLGSRLPKLGIGVPAFKVHAVDTTGAGDAFNAAFLVAWKLGFSLEQCLLVANAAGALKATRVGAHSSPTLSELNEFLVKNGYEPLTLV
ncbi:MAG: carbohydrate kinase family protein [Infirmifilum sp.]